LQSPAASAASIAFEEPRNVSNIRHLAIDPHVAALADDDPIAVERYRALAVKLMDLADRRKLKTLLITSAEAGEGKTTVATGTAWSLAKHPERRVLLIDASPNSSAVGRMLGIDPQCGWLNLLNGSCELKNALIRLEPNGLYVLTPGATADPHSSDTSSSQLEDLIVELVPRFDLVIVDSSPILESSEAQRLATILDGAVIVARASHTHHSKVTAARKLVPKERRLGVVLNESEVDVEFARRRIKGNRLWGWLSGRTR
jgi:capsular exopolysaccharide synthesis family protein